MNTYSVIFDGQKVPDSELFGVKQRLKEIFKADGARIETLFAGKPVAIKRNLSHSEAKKYQHMLKKLGVEVTLASNAGTEPAEPGKTASIQSEKSLFSLAPLGSDLLEANNKQGQNGQEKVSTDHLKLAPQQGNIIKASERQQTPEAVLSDEYTEWDLSNMGQDLLKQSEKQIWEAANIDTSGISFADKTPLAPQAKQIENPINTDHLKLLPIDKT